MSNDIDFRLDLVEVASAVMNCEYCRSHAPAGDQPQPGWVGSDYRPGSGVVVLLQNPGTAPKNYGTRREASVQRLLRDFTLAPSIETHTQLMRLMLADMAGEARDGPPWAKWKHPVSKLIPDRERLAWINVVKFRTPGTNRKDDPVATSATMHSITTHLQRELEVLQPKALISLGKVAGAASKALRLPPEIELHCLKLQGTSTEEVLELRKRLLDAGAYI